MNAPDSGRTFRLAALSMALTSLATALVLASCATVVQAPPGMDPERFLPAGALAYARLDQPTLVAALARLPAAEAKSAASVAERTNSMTVAFVKQPGSTRGGLVAVAEGRYPAGATSLKLASDPLWRKNGPVWERKDGSLNLAFADGGRVFLGTASIDGLLAAAVAPNPDPIPARWADEWSASIAVFLPDPMSLLRSRLPLGDSDVPMLAMMLSARPAAASNYTASLSFEFQTERTATIFSPLCRLFLYAAATALWPERSATVLDEAVWSTSGNMVTARNIPLDADSIAVFATMAAD